MITEITVYTKYTHLKTNESLNHVAQTLPEICRGRAKKPTKSSKAKETNWHCSYCKEQIEAKRPGHAPSRCRSIKCCCKTCNPPAIF